MPEPDPVDHLVAQWRVQRPDLEFGPMGTIGRLGRVHLHVRRAVEAVFEQHGLGVGEFDVLAALRRGGPPFEAMPSGLARSMMLSPAGMTNRIDRLEDAGLVERRADPTDRRSTVVALTDAGLRAVDAAVEDHLANETALLTALTDAERSTLDSLLRKLLSQFEDGDR